MDPDNDNQPPPQPGPQPDPADRYDVADPKMDVIEKGGKPDDLETR